MNDILNYYLKYLSASTNSLRQKGILVDKPWALLDKDGEIQKLIFKRDKGLILSKNGKVTEGSWEYYPEARALLINRSNDKVLLKEQYIDENVLILKVDGTNNDFYSLANENTIPDLNVPRYLNTQKCKKLNIKETPLLNGGSILVYDTTDRQVPSLWVGQRAELINSNYIAVDLKDGVYLSKNKKYSFHISDNKLSSVSLNVIKKMQDGRTIIIENGHYNLEPADKNKRITLNGAFIRDGLFKDTMNISYAVKNSRIIDVFMVNDYELKEGAKIKIKQRDYRGIKKGDVIVDSDGDFPLPDGRYKIRGKFFRIKVVNCIVS